MNLEDIEIRENNVPQLFNILLKYSNRIERIFAVGPDTYGLDTTLSPHSVRNIEILVIINTFSFTEDDYLFLGTLEFSSLEGSYLRINNIYSCEVLRSILKMNENAYYINNILENDEVGLNSTCLANMQSYKTTITVF